ncbi:MAG: hypothetical protein E7592_03385 [Ruminococcaceae bacterium]|nr:hypothetical protein [Oscillospiraceae bacterium]
MFENSYEYIIKREAEGELLFKRIAAIVGYAAFFVALTAFALALIPSLFIPALILICCLTALLIFITWRFLCIEYEILIANGDIVITVLYGKGSRKTLFSSSISSLSEIGEYDDRAYEEISKLSLQKNHICISSLSAPDVYYALFEDEEGRGIVYFDAPNRAVELLKKYNAGAFRASAKRINNQAKGI